MFQSPRLSHPKKAESSTIECGISTKGGGRWITKRLLKSDMVSHSRCLAAFQVQFHTRFWPGTNPVCAVERSQNSQTHCSCDCHQCVRGSAMHHAAYLAWTPITIHSFCIAYTGRNKILDWNCWPSAVVQIQLIKTYAWKLELLYQFL